VASRAGVPPMAFAPNVLAALAGWGACLLLAGRSGVARLAPWLALAAVAATLLGPGADGVHRWLRLGPLHLNASAALVPWLLLGLTSEVRGAREQAVVAALLVQLLHLAQPDAAQATALALGVAPALGSRGFVRAGVGLPALALLAGLAALAWLRLDGLPAVAHVEGILALARQQGAPTLLGALAALGLALLPLALPLRSGDPSVRRMAAGASLYLLGSVASTLYGSFPVPLVGAGAGPVLGWYGLALAVGTTTGRRAAGLPRPALTPRGSPGVAPAPAGVPSRPGAPGTRG
jgi:hypothetical protein